jgi:hypothetical protein
VWRQKRPNIEPKETCYTYSSVLDVATEEEQLAALDPSPCPDRGERDLLKSQKRPAIEEKETY